jgi:uncharacterized protein (DUF1501 family)
MNQDAGMTRRRFVGQSACAGLSAAGLLSAMGTLRLFNAALSAQTLPANDYKALICLFMYGGNDANNILVPTDTAGYNAYSAARGILALPRNELLPINAGNTGEYGLHSSLSSLKPVFDAGKMAFVANVGTLVAPITKAEYVSGGAAVPPYLFSHNDQQVQWQTSVPDSPRKVGWGGRLADLLKSLNGSSQISMNISLAGNNFFQVGNEVFQYYMEPDGSVGLYDYNATWAPRPQQAQALRETLAMSYGHIFESEYASVMNRAIANDTLMKNTLASIPSYDEKFTRSRNPQGQLSGLAAQLRMILRLITARPQLGMHRQIFFCSLGGFDTHDDQLNDQGVLLRVLSNAVADFYDATRTLGMSESVTLFTASDFNRTFSSNGKGSDHAWGSHQFIVGGAVKGGSVFGRMPVLRSNGPDDTGSRGSWIPTTSVDEYSATLAKWFGVSSGDMPLVLPNIARFAKPDLGFMMA